MNNVNKRKRLNKRTKHIYTDCKEDSAYTRIIKFLEESGLKIERPDLLKQIEDFKLEEYDCWIAEDNKEAMYIATESLKTAKMYKVEEVDEKILLYEELIDEMKCCENCKNNCALLVYGKRCDEDKQHWKLKNRIV